MLLIRIGLTIWGWRTSQCGIASASQLLRYPEDWPYPTVRSNHHSMKFLSGRFVTGGNLDCIPLQRVRDS
jgi:hypothetical protein